MTDASPEAMNPQPSNTNVATSASEKFHIELQKTVTVYGVTNRHLSDDGKSFEDGGLKEKKDDTVHYYREAVPVAGKSGDFRATGPGKIEVIDKATFDQETKSAVQHAGDKLGIYLHGIRNAIGEPGEKAAEISADSGETFVVEDWASTKAIATDSKFQNALNVMTQEREDDQSSAQSQGMINSSSEDLISKFGAKNIDVVAHSRGSVNEVRLLADLQAKGSAPIHSATFAHSDVDVTDFAHALPDFCQATEHVNVLYSKTDSALGWSALERRGQANLADGCTITDSCRLGSVGLTDQYLQNQSKGLVAPGYFLSMQDVTNDRDDNGHLMTSKTVANLLTTPDIWTSKANEMQAGPTYQPIDPANCKISMNTKAADVNNQQTSGTDSKKKDEIVLDQHMVERDFVSESPEVAAARSNRMAAGAGQHWLPFDNIWASVAPQANKQ